MVLWGDITRQSPLFSAELYPQCPSSPPEWDWNHMQIKLLVRCWHSADGDFHCMVLLDHHGKSCQTTGTGFRLNNQLSYDVLIMTIMIIMWMNDDDDGG